MVLHGERSSDIDGRCSPARRYIILVRVEEQGIVVHIYFVVLHAKCNHLDNCDINKHLDAEEAPSARLVFTSPVTT